MIGAGQHQNDPYNPNQRTGMNPYTMGPTFQPILPPLTSMVSMFSSPSISVEGDLSDPKTQQYLKEQMGMQGGAMLANVGLQIGNMVLAGEAMQHQADIAGKYYTTQQNIASYQQNVAMEQLRIQDDAIFAQQEMHREQMRHEEVMAEQESDTQLGLARINEGGRNERAKILSANNAFTSSRRDWDHGFPFSIQ